MQTETETKLRPLQDRVLIKRKKAEEKTTGGIILPDTAQKQKEMGIVIAVGPGKKDKDGNLLEMPVSTGQTVLWDKYSGSEVTIDEEEFVIVKSDEIIAIVEE